MAEPSVSELRKELSLKQLQLNALYEFSSALHSNSPLDDILRIFFSVVMGPLGLSRAFLFTKKGNVLRKRGFLLTTTERQLLVRHLRKMAIPFACQRVEDLGDGLAEIKRLLLEKQVYYLITISENRRDSIILGLGLKFNRHPLSAEEHEFVFFLSRFALIAMSNAQYLSQLLEKKRLEYEISIAREIQRSLLPQQIPQTERFDIAVIYEPIRDVGGDYYDFMIHKKRHLGVILADVEGKGLSSALLAASSQAIFHTMNELYLFQPAKFIVKANALITGLTRGQRFITLLWMLFDQEARSVTYVNAGHPPPYLISRSGTVRLDRGGPFMGFSEAMPYDQETLALAPGDLILAFTDGVSEVLNAAGKEIGEQILADIVGEFRLLPSAQIADKLYKKIKAFSGKEKFRDDFTLLLIKAK